MKTLIKKNSEVEFCQTEIVFIDCQWVRRIQAEAARNDTHKYRTCIHLTDEENVHEMLVAHTSDTYVRPHKHRLNGESLQIVEGEATAILFSDSGEITDSTRVGDLNSGLPFYYSMRKAVIHMLLIHSESLVFKETIRGPFVRDDTVFPDWAPSPEDPRAVRQYLRELESHIQPKR